MVYSSLPPQATKAKRAVIFKRAEQYVNEYNKKEREEIRLKRQAKANGDFYVPAQPKVYFVMRIKGCVASLGLYTLLTSALC